MRLGLRRPLPRCSVIRVPIRVAIAADALRVAGCLALKGLLNGRVGRGIPGAHGSIRAGPRHRALGRGSRMVDRMLGRRHGGGNSAENDRKERAILVLVNIIIVILLFAIRHAYMLREKLKST